MRSKGLLRAVVAGMFVVVALGLSLSDRVPALWRGLRASVIEAGRAAERMFAVDVIDRSDIPWQVDEIGHLVLWGTGMVVLGLAFRGAIKADVLAAVLFSSSVAVEVAQRLFTTGRALQLKDIAANGFGILLGLTLVVLVDTAARYHGRVRT